MHRVLPVLDLRGDEAVPEAFFPLRLCRRRRRRGRRTITRGIWGVVLIAVQADVHDGRGGGAVRVLH